MQQIMSDYEGYLRETRGAAPNTQTSYLRDIRLFRMYLEERNMDDFIAITSDVICDYTARLKSEGKSLATITRTIAGLKSFYAYLCTRGVIAENPVRSVQTGKSQRKLPQVLSGKEVTNLLEQPDCSDAKGFRDRAMLELLYATGIRVSELIALNVNDILMNGKYVKCLNHDRERFIPLYNTAAHALMTYTNNARTQLLRNREETALFVNCNGERMTRQGFWKIVKRYQEKARLGKEVTPQIMRHTFATHLLENGADLQSIQMLMGHADIASTQVYANLIKQRVHDVYQRSHPRAEGR